MTRNISSTADFFLFLFFYSVNTKKIRGQTLPNKQKIENCSIPFLPKRRTVGKSWLT